MKFVYYFPGRWVPLHPEFMSGAVHARLARAAEAAGFAAVALDEHPAPAESWRQSSSGHDAFDPFIGLAMVAGATTSIQLLTYLAVVPFRNPLFLAKEAATLDVVSDGRLLLGLGLGYMKDEFTALGVDFASRQELFDEGLAAMKLAWTGEPFSFKGSSFEAVDVRALPRPVQRPHPPVWIGGNGRRTLQRVASSAQGWMSMPVKSELVAERGVPRLQDTADLRGYIRRLGEYAEEAGRTEPIDIIHSLRDVPKEWSAHLDAMYELDDAGATWGVLVGTGATPDEAEADIQEYGERIIAKFQE